MSSIKPIPYTRKIDPTTGDYVISSGQIVAEDPIKQSIFLALKTVKGTSADELCGQEFSSLKVIKDNYANVISNYVRDALSNLISQNKILINQIDVYKKDSRISIVIQYKDLTKNINGIVEI